MKDRQELSCDVLMRWLIQDSLDARYGVSITDSKVLKWISSPDYDSKEMASAAAAFEKQLEFWGEATWGEAFPVSPANKPTVREAFKQHARMVIRKKYTSRSTLQPQTPRPPINGEYLLYLLLPKADQDFEVGDLVERYGRLVQRFNKRRADFWYYKQVVGFCFSWLRRIALKLGGLIWVSRILRRLIS